MKVSFDCEFLIQCSFCGADLDGDITERFDDGQCRRVLNVDPCDECVEGVRSDEQENVSVVPCQDCEDNDNEQLKIVICNGLFHSEDTDPDSMTILDDESAVVEFKTFP
jgi:hypothetical protein